MNNYGHAVEAVEVGLNSLGSAERENAAVLDSLEGHLSAVRSSFQQLATSVIDSDLAKSLLDIANAFLKILNTPIGTFVTQVALLGSVLWGGSGLISAMKLLPNLLNKAGTSFTLLGTTLKVTTPQIYLIAAAIVALISAIQGIYSSWREAHPTLEMIEEDISELNSELETNQSRLEELESIPWADRTTAQQAEIDRIKEENEELEKNLELKQRQYAETWKTTKGTEVTTYNVVGQVSRTETARMGFSRIEGLEDYQFEDFETYEEAAAALDKLAESDERVRKGMENGTITIRENTEEVENLSAAENTLQEYTELYNRSLQGALTQQETQRMNDLYNALSSTYSELDRMNVGTVLLDTGLQDLYDSISAVIEREQEQRRITDLLTSGLKLTAEQVEELRKLNPQLANSIEDINGEYYLEAQALLDCADASQEFKEQVIQDNIDRLKSTISTTSQEIQALLALHSAYQVESGGRVFESAEYEKQYNAYQETMQSQVDTLIYLQNLLASIGKTGGVVDENIETTTKKEQTLTDVLQEQLDILNHQAEMLERQGADAQEIIAIYKQAQQEIHETAEEYRRQGYAETSEQIRDLEDLWWDYADTIKDIQQEILEEQERLWEENLQNQINDLQSQADAWENAFQVVANKAQDEIDALEKQKDAVEDYYDSRIQALQDQNDELERQIQLEQAAMNLAQAESQQMLVYKDGRFQYVQNAQAISDAQVELERLEREEALRQEVANLEKLKDQAVASIDAQIEYWEKYKEEWASVVSDYQEQQDILLAEQLLGIELEGQNWELRLNNLQSYVNQYISILEQLSSAQAMLEGGFMGGGSNLPPGLGGGFGGGGGSSSGLNYSYVTTGAGGKVKVDVVNGKIQQTGLPVGSVLHNPNGQKWQITGGSGTDDDPYTSVLISGSTGSGGGSSSSRPSYSSGSSSSGSFHNKVSSANDTLLSGGHVGNVYIKGNARGTLGSEGGIRLVGENGPELRVLNQGDGIIPSEATKNLMEWGKISPKESVTSKVSQFFFDKLVLPNVTDLMSLQRELKNFNQFSFQH